MTLLPRALAVAALLCTAAGLPVLAASSASSASSDASSTSVGASSTSIKHSSNSSSKDDKVAAGEYRIVEVAAADAGQLQLQLQHVAIAGEEGALTLTLPRAAFEQGGLSAGQIVAARHRPYGVEFARADTREAFFLVLDDAWYRELGTHPVTL
jgi:hypothetical protein